MGAEFVCQVGVLPQQGVLIDGLSAIESFHVIGEDLVHRSERRVDLGGVVHVGLGFGLEAA
jgi:hypothetical protein